MSNLNIGTKILLVVGSIFILFTIGLSALIGTTSFDNLTQIKQAELERTSQILASRIAQLEQNATRAVISFEENDPLVSEIQLLTTLGPYYADPGSYFEADFVNGNPIEDADKIYIFQAQLKLIQLLQATQRINNFSSISFYQLSPFNIVSAAPPVLALRLDQETISLTQFNRKAVVTDQQLYHISTAAFKPPAPDYFDISSAYSDSPERFYEVNNFEAVLSEGAIDLFTKAWDGMDSPRSEIVVQNGIPILQTWYTVKIPMAHPQTWEEETVPIGVALVEQALDPTLIRTLADQLGLDVAFAYQNQLLISSLPHATFIDTPNTPNTSITPITPITLAGQETIHLNEAEFNYAWKDISLSNGLTNLQAVVFSPVSELQRLTNTLRGQIAQLAIIIVLVASVIIYISLQYLLNRPLGDLMMGVELISAGDLSQTVQVSSQDEVGQLAVAFNGMAAQLKDLINSLEQRVAARTNRLETVAELGERLNALLDVDQILAQFVTQIKEKFDYYHTYVYLIDEQSQTLVLVAAAGGDDAKAGHKDNLIPLDSKNLVAQTACTAEVVWLDDIRQGEEHGPSPLRLDAYAEMAVPIIAEEKVLGVLDVQENRTVGLDEADASMLRSLANYVAVALNNARLFEEVQQRASELVEANKAAEQARQKAERANQAKSEFLSNISHELRTPLNGILGYTHILKENTDLSFQQANGLNIIEQSGEHLLTLINDILDIAKIEAEKMDLVTNQVYLPQILTSLIDTFRIRAERKELLFRYKLPELAYLVEVDEKRLRQIIINLLSNAIRFTNAGQVVFRVIELNHLGGEEPVELRFEVADTGLGLTAEAIKNIFKPFEQVQDKRHQTVGTGLGLAISQNLAQMMGGKIEVESQPGEGSRFWFDLILPVHPYHPAPPEEARRKIKGYQGEQRKIMVVDDNHDNRSLIVDLLTPLGFEVIEATSGQEAIQKNQTLHPHFILMDLRMPGLNGLETVAQIRQSPVGNRAGVLLAKEVIIIAASASAFETDREESKRAGCNDFLAKPIKPDQLLKLLQTHLGLTWMFDNSQDSFAEPDQVKELVIPPTEDMQHLLKLAVRGKLRKIKDYANHLAEQNPAYQPFAAKLHHLAQTFQERAIRALIEEHFPPNQSIDD